jgi:two-component system response regulator AtoC
MRVADRQPVTGDQRGDGMSCLHDEADRIASSTLPVLIVGETGAGKERLAERIHARSGRGDHPFIRINCAAIPGTLFESELFGHEKGSFTGADRSRPGWFELAGEGTLFLDEIGEMPLFLQPKLLRVLDSRRVSRIGGREERPIRARFLAATNRDLPAEIARGAFRLDLYHRIAAVRMTVPPLRERSGEILRLAEAFLQQICEELELSPFFLTPRAQRALMTHGWPGNVRELRNVIERAALVAERGAIEPHHLMLSTRGQAATVPDPARAVEHDASVAPPPSPTVSHRRQPLADERGHRQAIVRALADSGGNQTMAAAQLGIPLRTFCRWLDRLDIPRPRKGGDPAR